MFNTVDWPIIQVLIGFQAFEAKSKSESNTMVLRFDIDNAPNIEEGMLIHIAENPIFRRPVRVGKVHRLELVENGTKYLDVSFSFQKGSYSQDKF